MRKVTFMTQVHNGERFVEKTIRSVMNQSEPDFWYFVRLNACTDGSEEIVRRLAAEDDRIVVLKNKKNYWTDDGIFCRKRGYWPAFDSEYVAVLDHDDVLHPDFIKVLYEKAKQIDADMAIAGNFFFDDETGKVIGERKPPEFAAGKIEDFAPYFAKSYDCLRTFWGKLIKAEIYDKFYEKIRIIPEELTLSTDTWVILELLKHIQRIAGVNQALLYYRISLGSEFNSKIPTVERIGDGKVLFVKGTEVLKAIHGETEENISCLYMVHLGHMADLIALLRKSREMAAQDKLEYLQLILKDSHLQTYRVRAEKRLFPEILNFLIPLVKENKQNIRLQTYYSFRLGELMAFGIKDKLDMLSYFSVILDQENPLHLGVGVEKKRQPKWIPKREKAFFQLPLEEREKAADEKNLWGCLQSSYPVTAEEKAMEEKMVAAMEQNEWVEAFSWMQKLDVYTLLNENSLLCRLMIAIIQENLEQAVKLACIGHSLFPENQQIQDIWEQLLAENAK